jgi:hypothetical protein
MGWNPREEKLRRAAQIATSTLLVLLHLQSWNSQSNPIELKSNR